MKRVDQKLGRIDSAKVFFDTFQIRKNRDFGNQIEAALNKASVFVSVFSPGYIASKACCEELQCFNEVVREKLSASGRLFVVHLDEVPRKKWPTTFQESFGDELLGYPFFTRTEGSNDTCPLAHDESNFLNELNRLRCAIAQQLESMKEAGQPLGVARIAPQSHNAGLATTPPSDAVPSTKPTILLAQSPPDLRKKRQNLADYCDNAELTVLGKDRDSSPAEQFAASFREDLKKTQLSVQLLSPSYSLPCEQFPQGVERWQFDQA